MKKIYTLFMVSAIALTTRAQLVVNENFTGYTVNADLSGQGNWTTSGSGTDVQVKNTTPLIYTGYASGTQYVTVGATNGTDPYMNFTFGGSNTTISTASTRYIYMSFVVNVSSIPSTKSSSNNTDYSISLAKTSTSDFVARFYIDRNAANDAVRFGIAVGDESPAYTGYSYNFGTTYLILIRYDAISGNNNDNAYLWVNPSSLAAEPTTGSAIVSHLSSNGELNGIGSLNALKITQTSSTLSPVAAFDAFRISNGSTSAVAWATLSPQGASLPVTLTSFNASQDGLNNTKLVWNASNESGIVSYVVEKSTDGRTFTDVGSVNATKQTTYSFTDNLPSTDYTYYRLKMVEQDGSFKYSFIVSLKSKLSLNISLSPNPVKNALLIQHPKVVTEGHIQIVNNSGQIIKDLRLPASTVLTTIDMSGLATGLYHVVFKNGTDVFSKMVLKQ